MKKIIFNKINLIIEETNHNIIQVTYYPGVYTNGECCLMKIQHNDSPNDGLDYDQYVLLLSQHDSTERIKFSVEIFTEDEDLAAADGGIQFELIPDVPKAFSQTLRKEVI